jgi:hypothetical protein
MMMKLSVIDTEPAADAATPASLSAAQMMEKH